MHCTNPVCVCPNLCPLPSTCPPLCLLCVSVSPRSLRQPAWSHGTPVGELQVLEGLGRDEVQEPASSSSFMTSSPPPLIRHSGQGGTANAALRRNN